MDHKLLGHLQAQWWPLEGLDDSAKDNVWWLNNQQPILKKSDNAVHCDVYNA